MKIWFFEKPGKVSSGAGYHSNNLKNNQIKVKKEKRILLIYLHN